MSEWIVYVGWFPGNPWEKGMWRGLGVRGKMAFTSVFRYHSAYFPRWGIGIFEDCELSPMVMKVFVDDHLIPNANSLTAIYKHTGKQLPRDRQLWGGAGVQGLTEPKD